MPSDCRSSLCLADRQHKTDLAGVLSRVASGEQEWELMEKLQSMEAQGGM